MVFPYDTAGKPINKHGHSDRAIDRTVSLALLTK